MHSMYINSNEYLLYNLLNNSDIHYKLYILRKTLKLCGIYIKKLFKMLFFVLILIESNFCLNFSSIALRGDEDNNYKYVSIPNM